MSKTTLYGFNATENGFAFALADGSNMVAAWSDFDQSEILRMAAHGIKQKVADGAAIQRNPETGKSASAQDKIDAMRAIFNRVVHEHSWNAIREGGGNAGGLLLRALCELYPAKTREQLAEFLKGKSAAEKTAMRNNPKIAVIIDRIRAESGKVSDINSDDLLDELAD